MLTTSGRRVLNKSLQSLITHNGSTADVLETLVEDMHEHPLLVPYQMINHDQFEDLVWGIIKIMESRTLHAPNISGNAAYVLGAILDTDVGKDKIFRFFADPLKLDQHKYILPNLTAIMESGDDKAAVNASGTLAVMVETETGRTWALKQPSFDWALHVLAKSVTSSHSLMACNCSLAIARICLVEEGCSRILNFRNSRFILTQLIRALGVDKEGTGMNSAFALAYLCEHEPGLRKILSLPESSEMLASLVIMLCSSDEGCSKNACFAIRNIVTKKFGQERVIKDPNIDRILRTLSTLLMNQDEETAKFAATGLRYLAAETEGYMQQRSHPMVKPTLRRVLSNPGISPAYRNEAFKTLQLLLLPTPEKPVLQVLGAHAIRVSWEDIAARSGLEVTYGLYFGDEVVYEGEKTSFVMTGLSEKTEYEFKVRAWTDEHEESATSDTVQATTFRAVSSKPRGLRAVSVTASQINLAWNAPERVYGVLNGYKVRETGTEIEYEPVGAYQICGNLKPDTEYTFEVSAVTKRGEGEKASITIWTLRQDSYAPTKPDLIAIGPHEILAKWAPPDAPTGRINGYELLVNGKRAYYGLDKRFCIKLLKPDTVYEVSVVAWTNEGRCESEISTKKTPTLNTARGPINKAWKTKIQLLSWLQTQSQHNPLDSDRSVKSDGAEESTESSGNQSARSSGSGVMTRSQSLKSENNSREAKNQSARSSGSGVMTRSQSLKSENNNKDTKYQSERGKFNGSRKSFTNGEIEETERKQRSKQRHPSPSKNVKSHLSGSGKKKSGKSQSSPRPSATSGGWKA